MDTSTNSPGNLPVFKEDCPFSRLRWWFSLSLSLGIYTLNILYLLIQWIIRYRSTKIQQKRDLTTVLRRSSSQNGSGMRLMKHNQSDDRSDENFCSSSCDSSSHSSVASESGDDERSTSMWRRQSVSYPCNRQPRESVNWPPTPDAEETYTKPNGIISSSGENRVKFCIANQRRGSYQADGKKFLDVGDGDDASESLLPLELAKSALANSEDKSTEASSDNSFRRHVMNWMASHKIGFWSAKNQLKLKLFCDQLTSVSYPKGRFLVRIPLKFYLVPLVESHFRHTEYNLLGDLRDRDLSVSVSFAFLNVQHGTESGGWLLYQ
ncbi:hypothetical protein Ciccas_005010 [Cichlidogyrus casuarinus]|uniref:Uncharacterized protein n=1 Tax=Cichlidogyrus casuarinus TaxID=1844966 RepID=A0ABD2Q9W2_9PLAT